MEKTNFRKRIHIHLFIVSLMNKYTVIFFLMKYKRFSKQSLQGFYHF